MKKKLMLMAFLFAVTVPLTALAAKWVPINSSKYFDIYVDKASIRRERTYSPKGIFVNTKKVIKGFANAGNYEICSYHYKVADNKVYVLKEFLGQYTPNGKKVEHHSAFPYKPSWEEIDNKLDLKILEYAVNNLS